MHRALALPEIVGCIFATDEPIEFFCCLLVNRLFYKEAALILWQRCGFALDGTQPQARHLANLAITRIDRAQYYANAIRELAFTFPSDWPNETPDKNSRDNLPWHKHLLALQFPKLETLSFHGPTSFIPLLQRNMTSFQLIVADNFLSTLKSNSPRLNTLYLDLNDTKNFGGSEANLLQFIQTTPYLSSLLIRRALKESEIWTYRVFESLARHQSLKVLNIPDIPDSFMHQIQQYAPPSFFNQLEELITGTSERVADILIGSVPQLTRVELFLRSPTHHILKIVSRLRNLTSLTLIFTEGSSIHQNDLLLLAKSCPNLTTLELPPSDQVASGSNDIRPLGIEINDSTVEEMAHLMPNLTILSLALSPISIITEKSFVSLGRDCNRLEFCSLAGNIRFDVLVQRLENMVFPSLGVLRCFLNDEHNEREYPETHELAQRFLEIMPQMWSMTVYDGDSGDRDFCREVQDLIFMYRN